MEESSMSKDASLLTRIIYCLVVLGAILPFGLAKSGWVALATGGPALAGTIPFIGPLVLLVIGIYRVIVVVRTPAALSAPPVAGFIAFLRGAGLFLLYLGAITTVLGWLAGPLMHTLMRARTESGAEFFFVGYLIAIVGQVGVLGLLLFELSRLRGFETHRLASA